MSNNQNDKLESAQSTTDIPKTDVEVPPEPLPKKPIIISGGFADNPDKPVEIDSLVTFYDDQSKSGTHYAAKSHGRLFSLTITEKGEPHPDLPEGGTVLLEGVDTEITIMFLPEN